MEKKVALLYPSCLGTARLDMVESSMVVYLNQAVNSASAWIDQQFRYLAVKPEIGSSVFHCASQKSQPVWLWASCTIP